MLAKKKKKGRKAQKPLILESDKGKSFEMISSSYSYSYD